MNAEQFWDCLVPIPGPGCLLYVNCWDKGGYGRYHGRDARFYTHRFAWELTHGPIPAGMMVCHKCDTPSCCNPDHLFIGTQFDNMADMVRKGRWRPGAGRSTFTPEQVRAIRADPRIHRLIAADYGVSKVMVTHIKTRRKYAKVA